MVQSRNIVFTGRDRVALFTEPVQDPKAGEVLIKARKTLISTGTEGICLSRLFAPGSHWDRWVRYPFHPGYSMVGEVVAVGPGVEGIREGERFALREPHKEYVTVSTVVPETQTLLTHPPANYTRFLMGFPMKRRRGQGWQRLCRMASARLSTNWVKRL